ncbi:unnamed protein product [Dracunculus medinensis]|uniref:Uncharacterized protein n=1 Tax=Dracunculus medinensis TaxID=318479 RepID=A0A3P7QQH1_DRAME|nr:unnamed protein product [Dracunculus medinensis]
MQREFQEQLLCAVVMRTITQCFGRGAIDFRSFSPAVNQPLLFPPLCLQAKLYPSNAQIEMSQSEFSKAMCEWGAFYNGVAAGLRLGDHRNIRIDCEWLTMNTVNRNASSAGLMYAFGLGGHIVNLNFFTIHELLSSDHYMISLAILIGYAVAKRTSADVQLYKMIVTHLPFMMGPTLLELHIDLMVQTAALVSLGLLFAQTSHLGILGQLINEIGRAASPNQEPSTDRYSYTLGAGFAVGLISLGKGDDLSKNVPFVERYPSLPSRLVILMNGGRRSCCVFPTEITSDLFPIVNNSRNNQAQQLRSNYAKESENVNPHLTGSAATIALGLMYLRTGNSWAAKNLEVPNSLYMIETIKPDLILLRYFF